MIHEFKVPIEMFKHNSIDVVVGDTYSEAIDFAEKEYETDLGDLRDATGGTAQFITGGVLVILHKDQSEIDVWHEALHASWYFLKGFCIPFTIENHEILAYLQGYVAQEIMKELKKIRKNNKKT